MAFCKEYNAKTSTMAGQVIPVEITVYEVAHHRPFARLLTEMLIARVDLPCLFSEAHGLKLLCPVIYHKPNVGALEFRLPKR
eukprot:353522-Chlamydomonas_euryale.AAC.5